MKYMAATAAAPSTAPAAPVMMPGISRGFLSPELFFFFFSAFG
ncbi:MAG: hypothetical protein VW876_06625 [Deltaproteobacteria bacterium]